MKELFMMESADALYDENKAKKPFYQPFLNYVEKTGPADEALKMLLPENCKLVNFDKGDRLLNVGKTCRYIYFIVSGECMSYYTDSEGKTTTWFFHFNRPESKVKNLFAVDYKSFLAQLPSTFSIKALSHVTAIRFSPDDVRTLTERSPVLESWLNQVNEQAYIQTYDKVSGLLTLSAAERYQKFLATEPHLLNMFSNYLVASYLNVAPQSLSRIRKQLACGVS